MKTPIAAALLLFAAGAVQAGDAHVCRSDAQSIDKVKSLTDNTVFTCGEQLKGTLPQLAKLGWQIVQIVQQTEDPAV
ncbi:hypothetical protein FJU30_14115 [Affinibrenneria salicis]|uniref:Uncharacterized protein n=1 Tax=Affinibrenneria salicis TaxID=2590031 RepID=A0A5J5FZ54_9GAMM|nr:hypothetical protein [Affinibrenneria salicis]KAA8999462.1 hypothetical protein FJU30_14115 [Affinibrenneria salicis]